MVTQVASSTKAVKFIEKKKNYEKIYSDKNFVICENGDFIEVNTGKVIEKNRKLKVIELTNGFVKAFFPEVELK